MLSSNEEAAAAAAAAATATTSDAPDQDVTFCFASQWRPSHLE